MRTIPVGLTILFVTTAFAGCVIPDFLGDGAADPAAIVKKATFSFDSSAEDTDELNDVLDVLFEYRHEGLDAAAAGLTAEYLDEDGVDRSRPLSDFATKATLREGDLVVIPNVNLTSGLVIRDAAGVVHAREPLDHSWFKAGGYPMPVTASEAGVARYAAHASSGMEFSVTDFEPEEGFSIDSASASWDARLDGTFEAATTLLSTGPRLDFSFDGTGGFDAEADVVYTEDGRQVNAGGRIDVDAEMEHAAALRFDTERNLENVSVEGRVFAEGDVVVWDEDHPKSENYRPEELENPLIDESYSDSETIEWDPADVEEALASFLDRLWNARIDVGDEYRYEVLIDEDDFYLRYEVVVQVVDREDRSVAAGTFDAFRVGQTTTFVVRPPGQTQSDFEISRFTYWIDAESALPVFAQGSVTRTFDEADLSDLIERFGGLEESDTPRELQWAIEAKSTMELEEYRGDLSTGPWFSANAVGGPAGGVLAAAMFMMVSDLGGDEYYAEAAPVVTFQTDQSSDRVTVTSASSGADWNRLSLRSSDASLHFELNAPASSSSDTVWDAEMWTPITYGEEPILAGDSLAFCVDGILPAQDVVVALRDDSSNAFLFETTFADIAAC